MLAIYQALVNIKSFSQNIRNTISQLSEFILKQVYLINPLFTTNIL